MVEDTEELLKDVEDFLDRLFKFMGEEDGFSCFFSRYDEEYDEVEMVIDDTFCFKRKKLLKAIKKLEKVIKKE